MDTLLKKSKKNKEEKNHDPLQPMESNKHKWTSRWDSMDLLRSPLHQTYASQLNKILADVFPNITKTNLSKWRMEYQKTHNNSSIWDMVKTCEDTNLPRTKKIRKVQDPIPQVCQAQKTLYLYQNRKQHLEHTKESDNGMDCCICYGTFDVHTMISCQGFSTHFLCRHCLHRYIMETVQVESPSMIPCPECKMIYPLSDIRYNLSDWDYQELERKDMERNMKVAFGGGVKATLFCECGMVAVIEEKDVGSGVVLCECKKEYCIQCGNYTHPGNVCPPPKETIQWVEKHAKRCPNCKEAIQKNAGCNHVYCAPPGGCGYKFCWLCLGPQDHCKCPVFGNSIEENIRNANR